MTERLKPCRCGGRVSLWKWRKSDNMPWWCCECASCFASAYAASRDEVVSDWNRMHDGEEE